MILASAEEEPELECLEIEQLLARGVDALLIASCQNNANGFGSLIKSKIPYVLLDRHLEELNPHFVGTDDIAAGRIATEHLIQLGRRNIAHIGGELISTSVGRLKGYKEALKANQIPFRKQLVATRSRLEEAGVQIGNSAMSELLQLKKTPRCSVLLQRSDRCWRHSLPAGKQAARSRGCGRHWLRQPASFVLSRGAAQFHRPVAPAAGRRSGEHGSGADRRQNQSLRQSLCCLSPS